MYFPFIIGGLWALVCHFLISVPGEAASISMLGAVFFMAVDVWASSKTIALLHKKNSNTNFSGPNKVK